MVFSEYFTFKILKIICFMDHSWDYKMGIVSPVYKGEKWRVEIFKSYSINLKTQYNSYMYKYP